MKALSLQFFFFRCSLVRTLAPTDACELALELPGVMVILLLAFAPPETLVVALEFFAEAAARALVRLCPFAWMPPFSTPALVFDLAFVPGVELAPCEPFPLAVEPTLILDLAVAPTAESAAVEAVQLAAVAALVFDFALAPCAVLEILDPSLLAVAFTRAVDRG